MDNKTRTWAEIDLTAIRYNLRNIKKLLRPETMLMAIVKANAYGHGAYEVARASLEEGASFLGVATLEEAMTLRESGINAPILVLGYIEDVETAIANSIRFTVFNSSMALDLARAASRLNQPARVHIKLDTGMSRLGFQPGQSTLDTIVAISKYPGIVIEGMFTHFAVADIKDKTFTYQQLESFQQTAMELEKRGIHIPLQHVGNSAAIIDLPEAQLDMVRAGIATYGLYPSREVNTERLSLIPAMRLISKITMIKKIEQGRSVSYGRTFVSPAELVVATVPVGYADGYSRLLSNRAWATVMGQKVPLIGRVCMDQCMFDVSQVPDIKEGDEIILFGRPEDGVTVDDLAEIIGTINYEVVCLITSRVPRIYT
ncbi:MAG: alanine racemase [Syntrophomonadaceae bacterium]|jgi:alanine racemase